MAYTDNRFCWHGIATTDMDRVVAFYPAVLGWTSQAVPMGDGPVPIFAAAEVTRSHVEPAADGAPSHWNSYLRVDDVDARAKAAEEAGGQIVVPPADIPPGRFAVVTSPSGAALYLFHEADPSASDAPSGPGAIHWNELWSRDIDADLAWLKTAFGFEIDTMQMPNGPYYLLNHGGTSCGGAMASTDERAPAMWLAWVQVDDVDGTVTAATAHGGSVIAPAFDVPGVGRMSILSDPTGAAFGVITPPAA